MKKINSLIPIISLSQMQTINEEKYEMIKKTAHLYCEQISWNPSYCAFAIESFKYSSDKKISKCEHLLKSSAMSNESPEFKSLVIGNVIFDNNNKFINALASLNYSYGNLGTLVKFSDELNQTLVESKLDFCEFKSDTKEFKHFKRICMFMQSYFGINNYVAISNKMKEIYVFHKEAYLKCVNSNCYSKETKTR